MFKRKPSITAVKELCESLTALAGPGDMEKLKAKVLDLNRQWERLELRLKNRQDSMKVINMSMETSKSILSISLTLISSYANNIFLPYLTVKAQSNLLN